MRIHCGAVNYTGVEAAATKKEAEAPTKASVMSFIVHKALSSLLSQAIPARWDDQPSKEARGHSLGIMPRIPLSTCPRGRFLVSWLLWLGVGGLRTGRWESVLPGTFPSQSPAQFWLCCVSSLGLSFFLYKMGTIAETAYQVTRIKEDNTPKHCNQPIDVLVTVRTCNIAPFPQLQAPNMPGPGQTDPAQN